MKRITFSSTLIFIAALCFFIILLTIRFLSLSATSMATSLFICGLVIIVASAYSTKEFLKTENIIFEIESQPLLETNEAVDGVPFAGEGIVVGDEVLESPYTKTPCVYFNSIKEKYVTRGKHSSWETVENIAHFTPFYLKDKRGKLKMDIPKFDYVFSKYKISPSNENIANLKDSEIDCEPVLKHHIYTEKGSGFLGFLFKQKYRKSEFVLRLGAKIFTYGLVSRKNDELVLHKDERHPLVISRKSRDQYVEEFYRGGNLVYLAHFLIMIGYTIVLLPVNYFFHLKPHTLTLFLLLGNGVIAGSVIFSLYNRIIVLKQRAINSLSNIEVELKRRADLIPNLAEAVKGYVKHESEIQKIIAEIRAKTVFSKELPEEETFSAPSLMMTIENYPNLKASEHFQALMQIIFDTEERIAYSREFYNRSVRKYNILISQFPFLLISASLKMRKMDFISIEHGEKTTPTLTF